MTHTRGGEWEESSLWQRDDTAWCVIRHRTFSGLSCEPDAISAFLHTEHKKNLPSKWRCIIKSLHMYMFQSAVTLPSLRTYLRLLDKSVLRCSPQMLISASLGVFVGYIDFSEYHWLCLCLTVSLHKFLFENFTWDVWLVYTLTDLFLLRINTVLQFTVKDFHLLYSTARINTN